jgi:hypothetical protein
MRKQSHKARLSKPQTAQLANINTPIAFAELAEGEAEGGPKKFSARPAYSGDKVPGGTLNPPIKHDYVIDLAGMTVAKSPKANLDHKNAQRVGHVTTVDNDHKTLGLDGLLSADTPHRAEVQNSAKGGYEWEGSIEASLAQPELLGAGKSAIVNGRTFTGPLVIFRKSKLNQIAFVSQGADLGNSISIAASAAGAKTMSEFDKFVASCGADPEAITDEQRATLTVLFEKQDSGTGAPPKDRVSFATLAEEQRQENKRQEDIKALALDTMKKHPMYIDQIERMASLAIEHGTDPERFELEMLRNTRVQAGKFENFGGRETDPKVIEAAMCMASGLPEVDKAGKYFSEQTLDAVDRLRLRNNFSLQQCMLQVAQANGYTCRAGERVTINNIRDVLEYCFPPTYARLAGFSNTSLPNILGEVANKQIRAGYQEEDNTWEEIAEVKSVPNFYTQNHFRLLDSMVYEEVGPTGEIPHGTLGEETFTTKAKTYARMLGLPMQSIVNDDLGAFSDIRGILGRGGQRKISDVAWTAFMDNSSFFTTALTNYITGATTNLGTDGVGLGLMVKAFRQMTTPTADGSKRVGMGLNPSKVIVPPELEGNAMAAYANNNMGMVANSSANIYQNRFRPVVQWRLSNSAYTGYGDKIWYMIGDSVKPIMVTFLNGNRMPIIESTEADFSRLGVLFRAWHNFGADKSEYLAGIKSKGEA